MSFQDLSVNDYQTRFIEEEMAHMLLDVRTIEEFEEARIPGAINIPLDELEDRAAEVLDAAEGMPIVVVCLTGVRSMIGAQILGYAGAEQELYNLVGGTREWATHRFPLASGPRED